MYVCLHVDEMEAFAALNKIYVARFGLKPPVRVCVQTVETKHADIGMSVLACSSETKQKV